MPPPRVTGHGARPGHQGAHYYGSCFGPSCAYGPGGAQRHHVVRPDDSYLIRNTDAASLLRNTTSALYIPVDAGRAASRQDAETTRRARSRRCSASSATSRSDRVQPAQHLAVPQSTPTSSSGGASLPAAMISKQTRRHLGLTRGRVTRASDSRGRRGTRERAITSASRLFATHRQTATQAAARDTQNALICLSVFRQRGKRGLGASRRSGQPSC